ncbi:CHAT domain-containing protein [Streptomyces sp. NPDC046759]|uniref:CHAT domain-containing protein n=1 Tax=Streptomyces sp. NPDC046759 TaxID=3155019 RepID=UPI0034064D37
MVSTGLLKATVKQRIERFLAGGNPDDLLTQRAAKEARVLRRSAMGFRRGRAVVLDAGAADLAALLYWLRGNVPSNPSAQADRAVAEKLLRLMNPGMRHPLPAPMTAAGMHDRLLRPAVLALELQLRYTRQGDPHDLERSIALSREGLAREGGAGFVDNGTALCGALLLRYEAAGDEKDLAEAVGLGRTLLDHVRPDARNRATIESFLSRLLLARRRRTGTEQDLEEALILARAAARDAPDGTAFRALMLGNLAGVLRDRFGMTGARADLDEAADIMTTVIKELPEGSPQFAEQSGNFGVLHRVRYEHGGDPADLDTALQSGRTAVGLVSEDNPSGPLLRSNLCLALAHKYDSSGQRVHLDEATHIAAEAVATASAHDPERGLHLHVLGRLMRNQYEHSGDPADLEQAIFMGRRAVESVPAAHPSRSLYLTSLSLSLGARYDCEKEPRDLHEAAELALAAVRSTPEEHSDRPGLCFRAALNLSSRGKETGSAEDLDLAVGLAESAVSACPPDHRVFLTCLTLVGHTLLDRYETTGAPADLEEATGIARRAVAQTPPEEPAARTKRLFLLGCALAIRHNSGEGDPKAAQEAMGVFDAARTPAADPALRVDAALAAGRIALSLGRLDRAARDYADAVSLMPAEVGRHLSRRVQERRLITWSNIPTGAAALAARTGNADEAVELLEAGRGFLLGRDMELRTGLDTVRGRAPHLAARLEAAAATLRAADDEPLLKGGGQVRRRHPREQAAQEWETALAEVRAVPGLADFLNPRRIDRLRTVAASGPVVMVNVSLHGCHALIVREEGVRTVPLALTAQEVGERATDLVRRMLVTPRELDAPVGETLRWLWQTVARPVLAELGLLVPPSTPLPRLWWCPTGSLAFLPLHAAEDPMEGSLLDRVVPSYTPTLGALARATEAVGEPAAPGPPPLRALIVAPAEDNLPHAVSEVDAVRSTFPEATVLTGASATRQAALDALSQAAVVHFACHGVFDPLAPSTSGLRLRDETMTVLDLSRLHLRRAELAYLSACSTAIGGVKLMDESIHLTSALQLAGFRQVIGTLWAVPDIMADQVAADVYAHFTPADKTTSRVDGAVALHHAVRAVRESHPDQPSLWAPYVHIGP